MATHDTNGREYARLSQTKVGDFVEDDEGFGCLNVDPKPRHEVKMDERGHLYIDCDEGQHFLEGQCDDDATDHMVGLYPAGRA